MILKKRIAKKLFCKKVLEKEYFEKSSERNYFEKSIGKQLFWEKVLEIRPDSVINPQNFRISLSGAAFLLFCRVLARPAKKKNEEEKRLMSGTAARLRQTGSLVETSVP